MNHDVYVCKAFISLNRHHMTSHNGENKKSPSNDENNKR